MKMTHVKVSESKTAIKKFRSRNVNTQSNEGVSHSYGLPQASPKCFNVLKDYKRVQKQLKLKGGLEK